MSARAFRMADDLVASARRKSGVNERNWPFYLDFSLSAFDLEGAEDLTKQACGHNYPESDKARRDIETIRLETEPISKEIAAARKHFLSNTIAAQHPDLVVAIPSVILDRHTVNTPVDPGQIRFIYREIFEILRRHNICYGVSSRLNQHGRPHLDNGVKYIGFRTEDPTRRGLHFSTTEKKGFFSFDRKGYAGWSEFSRLSPDQILALAPDQKTADIFFEKEARDMINSNASKYRQPDGQADLQLDRPYIFVAMQTVNDAVQQLAYVPMLEMLDEVCDTAGKAGFAVVAKRHPLCRSPEVEAALERHSTSDDFFVSQGSIHKLISSSVAVCTVNSSVGAEALLHLKPVFVFGGAPYQQACFVVREKSAFQSMFVPDRLPHDEAFIRKFFHVFRNHYELDIEDSAFSGKLEERILDLVNATGDMDNAADTTMRRMGTGQ
ncbi:hypothetical protein AAFN47_22720 [Hoeflea sp. CAU 1731]